MKEATLKTKLSEILPTAQIAFDGEQTLPYIVYLTDGRTSNICADDASTARIVPWRIELYTDRLMPDVEKKIEKILEDEGVIYSVDRAYIEKDRTLITYFFFEDWEERE